MQNKLQRHNDKGRVKNSLKIICTSHFICNVCVSSSRNNCHAVHRSLSSGASVYECIMGILACPILLANFRPHDSLS